MKLAIGTLFCLVGVMPALRAAAVEPPRQPEFKFTPGVSLRAGYDDNVFLQDQGDLANRESLVTTIAPRIQTTWTRKDHPLRPTLTLNYVPEIVFFHSESSENHVSHTGSISIASQQGKWSGSWTNGLVKIDGEDQSPLFLAPGGAPAAGGPVIRDRRDQFAYRTAARLQYDADQWFFRPVATGYFHDFQTDHSAELGYLNYVDRSEVTVGVDVGWKILARTYLTLSYSYGHQEQADLLGVPLNYGNDFHRVLVGIEGVPAKWLKVNASIGPDFRDFGPGTPDGFDNSQSELYVDATATVTPTDRDEIVLMARRFMQPGFGGRSVYNDSNYTVSWQHKLTSRLTTRVAFRAYHTAFELPALRRDWVYHSTAAVGYKVNEHFTIEAGINHEIGDSRLPDTQGREYERAVYFVGVKYDF